MNEVTFLSCGVFFFSFLSFFFCKHVASCASPASVAVGCVHASQGPLPSLSSHCVFDEGWGVGSVGGGERGDEIKKKRRKKQHTIHRSSSGKVSSADAVNELNLILNPFSAAHYYPLIC